MATAVHFGAGKIGLGFIGDLLHQSDYHIVFADVVEKTVAQLRKEKQYRLFLIDHDYQERIIDNVDAVSSIQDPTGVVEAITHADIVTTSVMASNLPKVAPLIAKGLKARLEKHLPKMTVMACENAIMGTDILKKAMLDSGEMTSEQLEQAAVYPNTAVDRVVFDGHHQGQDGIEVGDAYELAIERGKLLDPNSEPIKGAEYVDNLEMYLQRKIYIINCGHAISAYLGQAHGYHTVQEVLHNERLLHQVKAAMAESAAALEAKYHFSKQSLQDYIETMFVKRMTTPGLSDPVTRVGREPIRKLSPNDRIIGPANECESFGLDNQYLLRGATCALLFHNPDDKQAVKVQQFIQTHGIEKAIAQYTKIQPNSAMFEKLLKAYWEAKAKLPANVGNAK
ncbi:mannitol-1-phosphate 5-dehydrogenase [Lacticaseibacillus paracasei]|uniref:mannitol-1-phosphate 5-dehydrogenase n=1 Tax=Lacticaseibacillus paracasei TaxID=1597 RepID=UPI0031F6A917